MQYTPGVKRDSSIAPGTAGIRRTLWNTYHVNVADSDGLIDTVYEVRSKAKAEAVAEFLNWRQQNYLEGIKDASGGKSSNLCRWLNSVNA
jgi:hypothetical protein